MYRGGLHGEAVSSHDDREKKIQRKAETRETVTCEGEVSEVEEPVFEEAEEDRIEERQSQLSTKNAPQSVEKSGGLGMTETPESSPKIQLAKVFANITNDPRITNVLMLVIIAVGMGAHESLQTQLCSL